MRALLGFSLLLAYALFCSCIGAAPSERVVTVNSATEEGSPRILCIFAHPDDETSVAGSLYKSATLLGARVDLVVITDGQGGFKYSTLAERRYGLELTREEVGRAHLPRIRRAEMVAGCKWLEAHQVHFLGQTDLRYTTDPHEVLDPEAGVWDLEGVERYLEGLLRRGRYDFVLTMAPSPSTHGHHQAATVLAGRAVAAIEMAHRPVCLGVVLEDAESGTPSLPAPLADYPETRLRPGPPLVFDRTQPIGYGGRLDYRVLVDFVIAEHRSQGTMQLAMLRGLREHYFLFAVSPPDGAERAAQWMEALAAPQFPIRTYGPSAGVGAR